MKITSTITACFIGAVLCAVCQAKPLPQSRALLPSTQPSVETAFSPKEGSEDLVLKVINTSQRSIDLAAYSFTSPSIVKALIDAKKRGVKVRIVVDERGNKSKASLAALNLVVNAGIPTRTISVYAIHHDKYLISDGVTVQNGSFNYSKAAASSNSENVLVAWNNPDLARTFQKHWDSRWSQGVDYKSAY
jgi:phosphatidylserine/phosphatidylglycerophosphate/cardiolipin synthase-like enzyme